MFARTEVAMPHPSPIFSCSLAPPWRLTQLSATLPRVLTPNMKPRLIKSRSEEHTSELQSPCNLVCRLLLEKKKSAHRPHRGGVGRRGGRSGRDQGAGWRGRRGGEGGRGGRRGWSRCRRSACELRRGSAAR